jgi:hypothetical protein
MLAGDASPARQSPQYALLLRSRGRGTDHSQASSAPVLHPRECQRLSPPQRPAFHSRGSTGACVSRDGIHRFPPLSANVHETGTTPACHGTQFRRRACRLKWSGIFFRRMSLIGPRLPDPAASERVRSLGSTGRAYARRQGGRRGRV